MIGSGAIHVKPEVIIPEVSLKEIFNPLLNIINPNFGKLTKKYNINMTHIIFNCYYFFN
jgi:hypothetical protein